MPKADVSKLKVEIVPTDEVQDYPNNPRWRSGRAIVRLETSLQEYGWTNPILVTQDLVVVAGHGRLKAAEKRGLDVVPVIRLPFTEDEARAYRVADNRLADDSEWDNDLLVDEVKALLQSGKLDIDVTMLEHTELAVIADADDLVRDMLDQRRQQLESGTVETPGVENAVPMSFVFDPERYQLVQYALGYMGGTQSEALLAIARAWDKEAA